jgi:ATP-dependent Lhr-like helicase
LRGENETIEPEAFARRLLARWGILFRDVVARETLAPPWRELLKALRRLEARGEIRGGRFVSGYVGEQFALPEAIDALRASRRNAEDDVIRDVAAYDPLHLVKTLMPGAPPRALRAM